MVADQRSPARFLPRFDIGGMWLASSFQVVPGWQLLRILRLGYEATVLHLSIARYENVKMIAALGLLLLSAAVDAQDWPQACYNEVSMWVTNACKTYIEEVYLPAQESTNAAPSPTLGSGIGGVVLLAGTVAVFRIRRRRRARSDD